MATKKEISLEEVRHMAKLSRLLINEDEERLFARQFAQILGHMDILGAVDTQDIEPLYSPSQNMAAKREDVALNKRERGDILANAPETDGETFIVPRIV